MSVSSLIQAKYIQRFVSLYLIVKYISLIAQALCARYGGNRAKGRRSMKSDTLEAHVYRMNFRVGASKNMHYYSHGGHFV